MNNNSIRTKYSLITSYISYCKLCAIDMTPRDETTIDMLVDLNETIDKIFSQRYLTDQDVSDLHMATVSINAIIKRLSRSNDEYNAKQGD